jgi:hypothetical protein
LEGFDFWLLISHEVDVRVKKERVGDGNLGFIINFERRSKPNRSFRWSVKHSQKTAGIYELTGC